MKHWIEVTGKFANNKMFINLNNVDTILEHNGEVHIYYVGTEDPACVKETYEELKQMIKNSI